MKKSRFISVLTVLSLFILILGFYIFLSEKDFSIKQARSSAQSSNVQSSSSTSQTNLPAVSPDDWELTLVNREHPTVELNPEVTLVEGVPVDSRIAEVTSQFLSAVYEIDKDSLQGLYSGYRSVAEQETLFQTRVAEAVASGMTEEEATRTVSETVMPAGSSEHHTGLAIDLMKGSDVPEKIAAIAPDYGFVLRYPAGKEDITGISNEDWHFRYVGVESAKYMTTHQLVLEEYLELLKGER